MTFVRAALAVSLALAAACAAPTSDGSVDSSVGNGADALVADARDAIRPTWQLEDVQPQSVRVGQTYGLDAFTDHTVVVTLVEGF